ncbi:MAG: hypothetical protein U1E52_03440 [Geminicoccaceae bacterium]
MTASPAARRRASARLVAVAAARRLPSRISTTSEDANRNPIRVWVAKYEAGAFDDDATAADVIQA